MLPLSRAWLFFQMIKWPFFQMTKVEEQHAAVRPDGSRQHFSNHLASDQARQGGNGFLFPKRYLRH